MISTSNVELTPHERKHSINVIRFSYLLAMLEPSYTWDVQLIVSIGLFAGLRLLENWWRGRRQRWFRFQPKKKHFQRRGTSVLLVFLACLRWKVRSVSVHRDSRTSAAGSLCCCTAIPSPWLSTEIVWFCPIGSVVAGIAGDRSLSPPVVGRSLGHLRLYHVLREIRFSGQRLQLKCVHEFCLATVAS